MITQLAKLDTYKRGIVEARGHMLTFLAGNTDAPGEPIILIHGITSLPLYAKLTLRTPALWDRPWYAISLPGHAGSTYPDGFTEADLTAEYIGYVMATAVEIVTRQRRALIIGHSTGGTAALLIAAHSPEYVSAVISVSGFVTGRWGSSLGLSQQLASLGMFGKPLFWLAFSPFHTPFAEPNARFHSRLWSKDWGSYQADTYNLEIMSEIHKDMKLVQAENMWPWFRRMPHTDISPLLKKIKAPVLAIAGDKDPVVPPSHAQMIADATQGEVAYLKGVGHLPMQERRTEFADIVDSWVAGL